MQPKEAKYLVESLIFSSDEPLSKDSMKKVLKNYGEFNIEQILAELNSDYKDRGIELIETNSKYFFRTSMKLNRYLSIETEKKRNLSNAAIETLAIISYHQPVTRAEIEKIRGKPVFRGTLDTLLELKWIKPAGRRETPGRPVTWETDLEFLRHFGLTSIKDLPKVDELESIIL
ncbi:MAG: SMC-Scp complex subunit ScpB [Alphaproteobacteria bacterium]